MAPKEKPEPTPALPSLPAVDAAIRELLAKGMTRLDEIASNLPPGMAVSLEQVRGVLEEILNANNLAEIRNAVTVDLYKLLITGHSSVKHDPVNLA